MTTEIKTPQHLYCDTPPTILRNREEKFRTAKDHAQNICGYSSCRIRQRRR